jgi:arginase family enzyme
MHFNLILSQSRAADKTAGTLLGAAHTAAALEKAHGVTAQVVGTPSAPAQDDWRDSLPQALPTLRAMQETVEANLRSGLLTVLVNNTCSISLGSLPAVARMHPDAVLLWIDAHGDFNTPQTTDSGYLGGMVVAAACGLWDSGLGAGLNPEQVFFVGARDIDAEEAKLIESAGARIIPPAEVTAEAVLRAVNGRKVWVHIDWDVLEPGHVPADYAVAGGLLPSQIAAILSALSPDSLLGLEVAEYQVPADEAQAQLALETILTTLRPALSPARVAAVA